MNTSFFGELLQTISERGRALLARDRRGGASARSESLVELCEDLLSGRGEASGVALAREILTRYGTLTIGPRIAFFEALAQRFGIDKARMEQAMMPGARRRRTQPPPKCISPPNRAGRSSSADSISLPGAPPPWYACASN